MRELFERSEMKDYGGGSGVYHADHDTPLGKLRILHWALARGRVTEISIDGPFDGWPSVKLDGHVKPAVPLQIYLESLLRFGGVEVLAEAIKKAVQEGFKKGEESSRGAIRLALGFST